MSDKRMRPIVKLEPGGGDAQEQQAAAAATGGSRQRRRVDVGEEGMGAELEVLQFHHLSRLMHQNDTGDTG